MAQTAFVTRVSSGRIGKNETLEVSYEAREGAIENFREPRFPGWTLIGGPNVSSSTVITNGRRTSSMSYQFVLKPEGPGKRNIPGAKASIDGKQYSSEPVTVEVTNENVQSSNATAGNTPDPFLDLLRGNAAAETDYDNNNDGFFLLPGEKPETKTRQNIFAVVDISKKTCYAGEAIKASYKLYSRVNMNAHLSKRPSFSGFSSVDLQDNTNGESYFEKRNGKTYKVYPIRNVQLYPLQSGNLVLEPVEIETDIDYRKIEDLDAYNADPFASTPIIKYSSVIKSEPVSITVLPLPDTNRPSSFSGVTGKFSVKTATDFKDLAKNESGTLSVTVEGAGNWAMLQPPVIAWPAGVDVFEAVVTEKLDSQQVPMTGSKTWAYPFTCKKTGNITIPGVAVVFFDPEKRGYDSVVSDAVTVDIKNTETPLHRVQPAYVDVSQSDGTEIFTGVVKVVFPVVALLLVAWFIASYSNRKKAKQQEAAFFDEYSRRGKQTSANYPGLLAVQETSATDGHASYKPSILQETPAAATLIAEHAALIETENAREFFTAVRNKIQLQLKQNSDIHEVSLPAIRDALKLQNYQEAEIIKISNLLQLCNQHIYSPFSEAFDAAHHSEQLQEVLNIISAKN